MNDHMKYLTGAAFIAGIVLLAGWSVRAADDEERPAPPAPAEDIHDGDSADRQPVNNDPSLAGPRPERRGWGEGDDDARRRPRRGPGFFDDGRGRPRGWRGSDDDRRMRSLPPGETHGDQPPLTEEQIEALMEQVEEVMPELHQKMTLLRRQNPEQFKRMAERVQRIVIEMRGRRWEANRPGPPFAFFREMGRLADEYRQTESADRKAEIRSQMRSKLKEHVERRQEHLREEIKRMEERLAEMKEKLAEFEARKDECIDEHLEEILKGKGFGPPPGRGPRDRPFSRDGFRRGGPHSRPADGPAVRPERPRRPPRDN